MSGPDHGERARCSPRSPFWPPGARRLAGAAARAPARPGPPGTPSPRARPAVSWPTGSPGLPGPAASSMAAVRRSGGPRPWHRVRLRWVPRRQTGPALRPVRGWRCRRACAAGGVPAPGPAVAAAPAGGRRGGGHRIHTWPGGAARAGSGHRIRIVRRSGRRAGLAADRLPAPSGQPGPLQVRPRLPPPAAQRPARADQAARTTGRPGADVGRAHVAGAEMAAPVWAALTAAWAAGEAAAVVASAPCGHPARTCAAM